MPRVVLKFKMSFRFPRRRLGPADQDRLSRIEAIAKFINSDPCGGADRHHAADMLDALEQLVSVMRRVRAVSSRPPPKEEE